MASSYMLKVNESLTRLFMKRNYQRGTYSHKNLSIPKSYGNYSEQAKKKAKSKYQK